MKKAGELFPSFSGCLSGLKLLPQVNFLFDARMSFVIITEHFKQKTLFFFLFSTVVRINSGGVTLSCSELC